MLTPEKKRAEYCEIKAIEAQLEAPTFVGRAVGHLAKCAALRRISLGKRCELPIIRPSSEDRTLGDAPLIGLMSLTVPHTLDGASPSRWATQFYKANSTAVRPSWA